MMLKGPMPHMIPLVATDDSLPRSRRLCPARVIAAMSVALLLGSAAAAAPLPGMTAKEQQADVVWALRAGLNVAALQCQFSPFLMTTPNYNAVLRQHSDEFTEAFNTMNRYFIRLQGARKGARAFDTYATRTNQGFATFDAQYAFCSTAANLARQALSIPKGKFAEFSNTELLTLRGSLSQTVQFPTLRNFVWAEIPDLAQACTKRRC